MLLISYYIVNKKGSDIMEQYKKEMMKSYNVRYYVNNETRIETREDGSIRTILPNVVCKLNSWWYDGYESNEESTFIGKAVCAEGDEFNEIIGKTVAYRRAREKMLLYVKMRFEHQLNDAEDMMESINEEREIGKNIINKVTAEDYLDTIKAKDKKKKGIVARVIKAIKRK